MGPGPAKVSNVEINDIAAKEGEKGFSSYAESSPVAVV